MQLPTILRLLDFKPFAGKRGPEDDLSMAVANMLRAATLEGKLDAVWTSIPHEVGAVRRGSPQLGVAKAKYAKQKAMGMITGSGDFVFVWPNGGGFIELKVGAQLSPAQRDFRDWCAGSGNRYAVCKSVDEVVATLRSWGAMD